VKHIRVLIVDDSALVRKTLSELLTSDPEIEVMATAGNPFIAAEKIRDEIPDVILLDIEMPRMDGITFLEQVMEQRPIPVIICSSLTGQGTAASFKALEAGAVEVIAKPNLASPDAAEESRETLCSAVKAASVAHPRRMRRVEPALTADAVLAKPSVRGVSVADAHQKIVLIGASTGGTEALKVVLEALPAAAPGIAVVQHMPEKFTAAFAERLNGICAISVKEAETGDAVEPGRALIAPGGRHLLVKRTGLRFFVEVREGPLVCRHRPSVDVLFRSGARYAGSNAIGVLLTGMGNDGAQGLLELKQAGAATIAQDETTCVVYGMPHEAVKLGAADRVLPLTCIAGAILGVSHG